MFCERDVATPDHPARSIRRICGGVWYLLLIRSGKFAGSGASCEKSVKVMGWLAVHQTVCYRADCHACTATADAQAPPASGGRKMETRVARVMDRMEHAKGAWGFHLFRISSKIHPYVSIYIESDLLSSLHVKFV